MKSKEFFNEYIEVFLKQNSVLNLISKNDEKFLWEKHIFDSLAIEKFFIKYYPHPLRAWKQLYEAERATNAGAGVTLLDIGTGGGFPSVPIALCYPEIEVYALDSIRKKINAIENIKQELNIKNLHTICGRVENLKNPPLPLGEGRSSTRETSVRTSGEGFDIVTSRAVASLDKITDYAMPKLKNDGYFVAYKSIKAKEEIAEAKNILKKHKAEVVDIIEYDLPLEENHTRNLIIIKKVGVETPTYN